MVGWSWTVEINVFVIRAFAEILFKWFKLLSGLKQAKIPEFNLQNFGGVILDKPCFWQIRPSYGYKKSQLVFARIPISMIYNDFKSTSILKRCPDSPHPKLRWGHAAHVLYYGWWPNCATYWLFNPNMI